MDVGGAWASLPLDTLHVVLTKPGQAGLELSKEAVAELENAEAAAARFSHAASGEPLVNADPQAAATAVVAQLAACMDELQDAGVLTHPECISPWKGCSSGRPSRQLWRSWPPAWTCSRMQAYWGDSQGCALYERATGPAQEHCCLRQRLACWRELCLSIGSCQLTRL